MPKPPVPPEVDAFLREPNPAVIATLRPDGSPHTVATWYDWEDGRMLVNMDESRLRLGYMRHDPRVAMTILSKHSWYEHISILGRVVSIKRDPDLADIDRLSQRYLGHPYSDRERKSWSAWIEVDRWHGWVSGAGRR